MLHNTTPLSSDVFLRDLWLKFWKTLLSTSSRKVLNSDTIASCFEIILLIIINTFPFRFWEPSLLTGINTADTIVSENIYKKNQGNYFVKSIGVISGSSYLFFLPAPLMRDVLHGFLLTTTTTADQRFYKEEESKYTSQFTSLQIIYF